METAISTVAQDSGKVKWKNALPCSTLVWPTMPYRDLASYKSFETHLITNWPTFSAKRSERLKTGGLNRCSRVLSLVP
jgi:hypothetical protein